MNPTEYTAEQHRQASIFAAETAKAADEAFAALKAAQRAYSEALEVHARATERMQRIAAARTVAP